MTLDVVGELLDDDQVDFFPFNLRENLVGRSIDDVSLTMFEITHR